MKPKATMSMTMWDGTTYEVQYMGLRDTGAYIFRCRTSYSKGTYQAPYKSTWTTFTGANMNDMTTLHKNIRDEAQRIEREAYAASGSQS